MLREHERRELPEDVFGAELAQAAAGEPAADGEGQRAPLAGEERRDADHRADDDAGVRAVDEAGEKGAFERQVGGVVAEQQPRGDAGRQQDAEAQRERQAVGRRALFEDQKVPEAAETHQNRGRRGHDGQLHQQRREQHLGPSRERSGRASDLH